MKIRFLKISQVIDNQVIVKNIETENSIADGIIINLVDYFNTICKDRFCLSIAIDTNRAGRY
jgi:hypothetical protein